MKRKIISIDEEKCTGCGECIPDCPEGAIQLIDGKARLISDLFCDGLGAVLPSQSVEVVLTVQALVAPGNDRLILEQVESIQTAVEEQSQTQSGPAPDIPVNQSVKPLCTREDLFEKHVYLCAKCLKTRLKAA